MEKLNLPLMFDRLFRRTIFLRPLPDKSFEAVDITGSKDLYIKDDTGATYIDPACIVRVRGIKRVDYIAIKRQGSSMLTNMFDGQHIKVKGQECKVQCPACQREIAVQPPDTDLVLPEEQQMTEKTFGDTLNYAEVAGRMQAERNPEADKKQNLMLLMLGAAVLLGVVIFFKLQGA